MKRSKLVYILLYGRLLATEHSGVMANGAMMQCKPDKKTLYKSPNDQFMDSKFRWQELVLLVTVTCIRHVTR